MTFSPRNRVLAVALIASAAVSSPSFARSRVSKKAAAEVKAHAGAGMALRAGAILSTLDLGIAARRGRFSAGLRLPVQVQILSTSNEETERYRGLREKDWDERAEWLRLLDHAAWRWRDRHGSRASLVVAPLGGATLGHGSVVHRYQATLRPDRFKSGARLRWDLGSWGGDVFTDDVTAARIIAGRVFARPLGSRRVGIGRTVTLGATLATDRSAPTLARHDAVGARIYKSTGALDAHRGAVVVGAFDLSAELFRTPAWSVVPYADLLYTQLSTASGLSAHFGGRIALWPGQKGREIGLRYELRALDGGALPSWFDGLYEVENERWLAPGPSRTKVQAAADRVGGGGGASVLTAHFVEVTAQVGRARWVASLQRFDQPNLDTASLWCDLPMGDSFSLRVMASKRRFSGLSDVLSGGHWTTAATVRAQVVAPFDVFASLQNAWHVVPGQHESLTTTVDGIIGLSLTNTL